ncbi:MAG: peptidylprolyl isomerase [Clostridia bacterium]|nr:peptidylprolyl isomerase [Clostridia bacterium]
MKKIISSILAGVMMLSAIPAMANDINITIDNEVFIPKNALGEEVYPFIENGSTYLPVRAMGEAVGKEVAFDAENYAVYIGIKPMAQDVEKMPVAMVGDRVFYEEDLAFYGTLENMIIAVKLKALAESMFTQSEIESRMSMVYAFMTPQQLESFGDDEYSLNEYIEVLAYTGLISSKVEVDDSFYNDYATVKHILVEDEIVAKEILEKIGNGEDFAALIEEYNQDPGQTKDSRYTFTYGEMVEEFEKAAFELEEGQYTKEAVKTSYGYHIITRLPLDKNSVNVEGYKLAVIEKMMENVEVTKAVEIKREGDYAVLEGFTVTTDDLAVLGGTGTPYNQTYELLESLVMIKKYFDSENILTDEEKAEIAVSAEEYLAEAKSSGNIEKDKFFAELIGYYSVFFTKLYMGEIPEDFDQKSEQIEVDSNRIKSIRVFVDGNLIVPGDVNNNFVEPKNIEGTVYVPVRAIVEALGMKADWDNDTRTVVITK